MLRSILLPMRSSLSTDLQLREEKGALGSVWALRRCGGGIFLRWWTDGQPCCGGPRRLLGSPDMHQRSVVTRPRRFSGCGSPVSSSTHSPGLTSTVRIYPEPVVQE